MNQVMFIYNVACVRKRRAPPADFSILHYSPEILLAEILLPEGVSKHAGILALAYYV